MGALKASYFPSLNLLTKVPTTTAPHFRANFPPKPSHLLPFNSSACSASSRSKLFTAMQESTISTEQTLPETDNSGEKFDWYAQWYPIMPTCDLDKRIPHAKKVLGIDVVVWFDRNENTWKVFDDSCPHRLAPLSEGRIDQWGRLQCVYHGWCFNGSGDCKLIPQAPLDGPPVHTSKKACVAVYPSTVQHEIVWFWPNSDPQYKDILSKKQPPYIPELEDPTYTKLMQNREIPYGYEVLIENLMDPAHVPYAHYGIMNLPSSTKNREKVDREGGSPMPLNIVREDINGFIGSNPFGNSRFIPPCVYSAFPTLTPPQNNGLTSSDKKDSSNTVQKRALLIFICIPVSPGNSRLIWTFPRNFGVWIDQIIPRWIFHIRQNLILDSDLYLLHVEERKIMEAGPSNWQKACFVPTKSDANVVAFRKWLRKYSGGQVDWGSKFSGALPPSPPREQLMDRYWSHVVNCSSCSATVKALKMLEAVLPVISLSLIAIIAATKQNVMSAATRTRLVSLAVVFYAASKWLSHFIYKTFHFHDYSHGLR